MKVSSTVFALSLAWLPVQTVGIPTVHAEPASDKGTAAIPLSTEAVIQHEFSSQIHILLLISGLDVDGKSINSPADADRIYKNTKQTIGEMQDNGPSQAIASNISRDAARLLSFYLASREPQREERLGTASKWLETYTKIVADGSKKPETKARALYFNSLAKFLISEGADGIASLVQLRPQLAADKVIAANIDMFLGYSLALSPATAAQGYNYMAQASQNVSVHGRVAQKLTEAYVESGLDADGNPTLAPQASANDKVGYALQIARGMPPSLQYLITDTAIYIWSKSKSAREGGRPPQNLTEGFKGNLPVEALRERDALAAMKAQNFQGASGIYQKIIESLQDPAITAQIQRRIWDLALASYQKNGQITELEATFVSFREKLAATASKKKAGPDDRGNLLSNIAETYRGILDKLLTQALQAQAPLAAKTQATQVAARYFKIENDRQLLFPLKQKVALLYRGMNQFKDAVDLYLDMARDQGLKSYLLAIEAQSQLAVWPVQPNFDAPAAGPQPERQKLLVIYDTVSKIKGSDEWLIIAHIGLLNRALGQAPKAEELWQKYFRKDLNGKIAYDAGGLLLTEFYSNHRWQDFIDLTHLFASKKAAATSKGKPLNIQPWLADALFNGAGADLQAKNFARAVKNYDEFTQTFTADARSPQAFYSQAFAYKGLGKLPFALAACRKVVDNYPKFASRSKVLLQAGEWASADRTVWEFAFYFYGKYLSDFKNEANIPAIRSTLADLYYKRKLYGWASRLYKEQSLAPNVSKAEQLQAAVKLLEIEEHFGEAKDAFWGAQRIAQIAAPSDPAMIKSLAYQGRYIANAKDAKAMTDMENKLTPYSKSSKEVLEAIGLIRFKRAEMMTQSILYTENNLLIRDPEAVVKKYFDRYEAEKQHYLKVCQLGITTLCAPAFYRLTSVARQGYEAVDKVEIAATLGATRTNSFKVFKQLHLSKIEQNHKGFIEQALKLAKQGTTTPIWREEIAKSLEYEGDNKLAH